MIDDNFVQAAIKIRREYLKLTNNLNFYKTQANRVIKNLEDIVDKLEDVSKGAEFDPNAEATTSKLLGVLKSLEVEGKNINELVDPLNAEIEKLSLEEAELWRKIKSKHSEFSDEQIVTYIKSKFSEQNLLL